MNLLNSFSFELPTRIEYGVGATDKLADFANELGVRKVLFVTDRGIEASGILTAITDQLSEAHLEFDIFSDVEPNPKDHNVHAGAEMARSIQADCLVAVGGGSPIDCAKSIAVLATHDCHPDHGRNRQRSDLQLRDHRYRRRLQVHG